VALGGVGAAVVVGGRGAPEGDGAGTGIAVDVAGGGAAAPAVRATEEVAGGAPAAVAPALGSVTAAVVVVGDDVGVPGEGMGGAVVAVAAFTGAGGAGRAEVVVGVPPPASAGFLPPTSGHTK
jgi:hypothetical protein